MANEEVTINEDFKNTPLAEVFKLLKSKYQLKIAFANRDVQEIEVTARINQLNLRDAFKLILNNTPLTFEVINKNTVILRKKKIQEDQERFSLNGEVTDAITGERLPYAYVWLEADKKSFTTNVEGFFSIPDVSTGSQLRLSYLGYKDTLVSVSEVHQERRLNIKLNSLVNQLDEIVVLDDNSELTNFRLEQVPGKFTFSPAIAKKVPSAGEVDVFRSLQLLPGINATNEVSSGLTINGGTSTQNLVLFDGFTVYHVDHFFGYFSAFNPLAVKSVQLYKTGFEAKYGGRVSSVVDITGKDGNQNKTSGSLGLNLLSVNSSIEVPLSENGTTLFFSGRRSYTDIWSSSLFENIFSIFESSLSEETEVEMAPPMPSPPGQPPQPPLEQSTLASSLEPEFYYTDMNIKLSGKLGPKNRFSFSFYDSNDILNYTESIDASFADTLDISSENIGFITWGNVGTSLKLSRLWDNRHFTQIVGSYSFYESTFMERSSSTSISSTDGEIVSNRSEDQINNIQDVSLKLDHTWEINGFNRIEAGIGVSSYGTQMKFDANDSIIVDEETNNELLLSSYLQGTFLLGAGLTITPGIRHSYLSTTAKSYVEPRFSFSYDLNSSLILNGALGRYYQFINQSNTENVLEGSRDFWLLANDKSIPTQMASHYLIGVTYDQGPVNASVNYFRKDFDGLLEYAFRNGDLVTEFNDPSRVFAHGSGYSRGVEFLLKRDFGSFDGWFTYTVGEVRHQFDQINGGRSYYADHDQRHEFNVFGAYHVGDFEFSMVWVYGSGTPYSSVQSEDGIVRMDGPGPSITQLNVEEKNDARLPSYHRMDLSASYAMNLGNTQSRLSLSIFNIYNRENVLDKKINVIEPARRRGTMNEFSTPIATYSDILLSGTALNVSLDITF